MREAIAAGQTHPVTYYKVETDTALVVDGSCKLKITASPYDENLIGMVLDVTGVGRNSLGTGMVIEAMTR
jgi:hypothetical protein